MKLYVPGRPEVEIQVTVAVRARERMKGLRGKASIDHGEGVLLRTKQIHTFGMKFAIDVIYLSRTGRVVRVDQMKPGRLGPIVPAAVWVLEMASDEAERLGIRPGTELVMEED